MSEPLRVTVDEIRLRNFRAFENARLSLSDLTFIVGRNGAGKSSLLDAVDLLREAVTDSLENAMDRRGGLLAVRRLAIGGDIDCRMGIAVVLSVAFPGGRSTRVIYGFELVGGTSPPLTVEERFLVARVGNGYIRMGDLVECPGRRLDFSPPLGNLLLPLAARADSLWEAVLETIRNLRSYELSAAHMALASEIGDRTTLAQDGANAGDVLRALGAGTDHDWLVQRLGLLTDDIVDVRAEALLGRRVLRFVQEQGGIRRELDASQASHGTLRALGILLALRQHPTPSLVLIDEIENSVHPGALSILLDAALASCERTRVVLTSHSPEALSHPAVTGERVRVVEWHDGVSRLHRLSPATQEAVNSIDTVGWMLRSNALWTAPEPDTFPRDLFDIEGGQA